LANGNLIERDKAGFSSDLSWRDAEHYLFAYDFKLRTGALGVPTTFYSFAGYSPAKMILDSLGLRPSDMSPGSFSEAKMGIDGSYDALDRLAGLHKDNPRWGKNCDCQKK
jgi:hypothetical protein